MRHSFLFLEADWVTLGQYCDEKGCKAPLEGESRIRHRDGKWVNEGKMVVRGETPAEFSDCCEITPFPDGADDTAWTSENPTLGRVNGRFALVADAILSMFHSEDGRFWGSEYLQKLDDTMYQARGVLFCGDHRVSSWVTVLQRQA